MATKLAAATAKTLFLMLFFSFGEYQIVNTVRSPPIRASDYWLLPESDARRGEIFPRRFGLRREWTAVSQHQLSASL